MIKPNSKKNIFELNCFSIMKKKFELAHQFNSQTQIAKGDNQINAVPAILGQHYTAALAISFRGLPCKGLAPKVPRQLALGTFSWSWQGQRCTGPIFDQRTWDPCEPGPCEDNFQDLQPRSGSHRYLKKNQENKLGCCIHRYLVVSQK